MKPYKNEEVFHNSWAKTIEVNKISVNDYFEACTAPENRLILQKLGNIKNKKILEIGCGAGEASVYFAKLGAKVMATDLSDEMLLVAKELAGNNGVSIKTKKCSATQIDLPSESFDIIYAANLLHHVDIEKTLHESQRIIKKGGLFVSWDPLAHNPIINVYRQKASSVRTPNEHPLRISEIEIFRKYFSSIQHETTWLFTQLIFIKLFFIDRIDPNVERYWKKIIYDHKNLEKLYCRLEKIDKFVLSSFPFLKKYCWNIIIFAQK